MQNDTQAIIDDNGVELIVDFDWERGESQIEECHGYHEVGLDLEIGINSVKLVIGGVETDITKLLNHAQLNHLISKIEL